MYAERLGQRRAATLNPYAAMSAAGVVLALGSDSPVTSIDPWGTVRAAVAHRTPGSGLDLAAAFAAHTRGGRQAAGDDTGGVLTAGAPATFAVWTRAGSGDAELPGPEEPAPTCRGTVVRGISIYQID